MAFLICFLTFLAVIAAASSKTVKEMNDYLDSVLLGYLPEEINKAQQDPASLQDFSHFFQNRTPDGDITNGNIHYKSGTLSGLGSVSRNNSCQEPLWLFANLTVNCTIVFPSLQVNYMARITYETTELERPLRVQANISNSYALVEVSSTPHFNVPSLKLLKMTSLGSIQVRFRGISDLHYHVLNSRFIDRFTDIFGKVFNGPFRKTLSISLARQPLPMY